jgi:hypothetical protein
VITPGVAVELLEGLQGYDGDAGLGRFTDLVMPDDGVCWGLARIGVDDVLCYRGTRTDQDLLRDLFAIPHEPADHPELGDVDLGFFLGMEEAVAKARPLLRGSITLAGYSLGAARATQAAGLLIASGVMPSAICLFGTPRPGGGRLQRLVSAIPQIWSFRNAGAGRHDPVTDVPTDPPFRHSFPLTDIWSAPPANDPWGPILAPHHLQLYAAAVRTWEAKAAA